MEVRVKKYCWCGSGRYYESCHKEFDEKIQEFRRRGCKVPGHDIIKTESQIQGIRESARLNVAVLDEVAAQIREGMSTEEIDKIVYEFTMDNGGIPAPLNYEGFPKSVCVSRNDVICHGIPSKTEYLRDGDIVNVDVSTIVKGFFSDSSRMFCIGNVPSSHKKLVEDTQKCVRLALERVKPWQHIGNIGQAISDYAGECGYSVVREIGGHGVGLQFHEEPFVPHVAKENTGMIMVPGMIFTIEPMVNLGTHRFTIDKKNGWTVRTADGKPSAQWENQVLVTEDGYEILAW